MQSIRAAYSVPGRGYSFSSPHGREGKTPVSPLHVGHCLTSSRTYFDSARLPKGKASFLFGPPARRSKGAGWTQGGTGQGLGRKAATLAGTQHPLSSPHFVAREVDGTARSVTIVLGSRRLPAELPRVMGIAVASRGRCPKTPGRALLPAHLAILARQPTASL